MSYWLKPIVEVDWHQGWEWKERRELHGCPTWYEHAVKTSIFEMSGSCLAKVAVNGVGLEASTLLTGFVASAMI